MNKEQIKQLVDKMTIDELVGQTLNFLVPENVEGEKLKEYEELCKKTKPGSIFFNTTSEANIKRITEITNKYTPFPVIVAGDIEHGPNVINETCHNLPNVMAWGASDDEKLIEKAGELTAQISRKSGIHWAFAPVVDINANIDAPCLNTRATSDCPEQVIKISGAYLRGLQKNNLLAGCLKHFPGSGYDNVNSHFATSVVNLNKEEWMATIGKVYKELIKENPASIMTAHYSFPAVQGENEKDETGCYIPATISYDITTKLLREELGYDGCIVSDGLCMVGVAATIAEERLPVECLKSGCDLQVFAEPPYFDYIKEAVESGEITMERLKDAVTHILMLKDRFGLLDGAEKEITVDGDIKKVSTEIAEKSIKVVRDIHNVLPVDAKKGDTILICNLTFKGTLRYVHTQTEFAGKALEERGINVIVLDNPMHRDIEKVMEENDLKCILVNSYLSESDSTGSSLKIDWQIAMTFWRGIIFKHPKVIFTSFGDPYKIGELPFLRTYINAFSNTKESQEAAVRVILGEIEPQGKNPVNLEGFFKREVFPD